MAILAPILTSALDHSAIFLTDLAGRTVKNCRSPRGPRFEPGRPQTKIHRSILQINVKNEALQFYKDVNEIDDS